MGCPGISDGVNVREAEHDGGVVTDEDVGRDKDAGGTGGTWVNSDEGMADDEVVGAGGQGKFLLVPELADGRPTCCWHKHGSRHFQLRRQFRIL